MVLLSTGSLYNYGLARAFGLAAEAGYDGVEVLIDGRWDTRQPAYLRRLSESYHLPILVVHNPFVTHVPGWPDDELGRLHCTLELAQSVGAATVVVHLPMRLCAITGHWHGHQHYRFLLPLPIPRRGPYYRLLRDGVEELEADSGVKIAVENMPAKRFLGRRINPCWFNTVAELDRFPHLTLDTTHLGTWGLDPLAVYDQLQDRVAHVHLSNFDGKEHRSPPEGHLRLGKLLRRLASDDYPGVIAVECAPRALDAEDEGECLVALRRALAFCRSHLRQEE